MSAKVQQNRIAIIAVWFGTLPPYFPAWLLSAERNNDIDFLFFTDQRIEASESNIRVIHSTLRQEAERAEKALREPVSITEAYKFCDVRPFFGVVYQEYLVGYDFWGYCDIDLVFGRIRSFLTDELLQRYDRFYEWGHFSLFRNNEKMARLYELPGSLYSKRETLCGDVKVNAEEHHGLNRICERNHIAWYKEKDYADFWVCYSDLLLWNGMRNDERQVFYWEDGHARRAYLDKDGKVRTDEYVYIHWQKRTPKISADALEQGAFFITSTELEKKEPGIPDRAQIERLSPAADKKRRKKERRNYLYHKMMQFLASPWRKKCLWIRQKFVFLCKTGHIAQQ